VRERRLVLVASYDCIRAMALRIGTFNVQLFTDVQLAVASKDWVGAGIAGAEYAAAIEEGNPLLVDKNQQSKALRFAQRILDAPYDLVCFQEMWSGPAWARMSAALLAGGYVFARDAVGQVELNLISVPIPSGVAVASRLPPVPFRRPSDPGPVEIAIVPFVSAGGADRLAMKSVMAFVVDVPCLGRTVVATTHLQADYSLEGEPSYADVRAKQLDQIDALVEDIRLAARADRVVVCGDLNIRAEPVTPAQPGEPPRTHEYLQIFGWRPQPAPTHQFGARLRDGWTASSPDETAITSVDNQRLDIVATNGEPRGAVVRHIMLARNLWTGTGPALVPTPLGRGALMARGGRVWESDHNGVNAIIGPPAPHGTPSLADPVSLGPGDTGAWVSSLDDGAPRWLLLTEPGTYRVELKVVSGADARMLVFEPRDLSAPFAWLDPGGSPPPPPPASRPYPGRLIERHRVGGPLTPLYVRAQSEDDTIAEIIVVAYRSAGVTPDDAILIDPHVDRPIDVPPNQNDVWLELQPDGPPLDPVVEQTVELRLHGDIVAVDVVDPALAHLPNVSQPAADHVRIALRGPQRVLVRVQTPQAQSKFGAYWSTDLKTLHGGQYEGTHVPGSWALKFHCNDETGPDWVGDDEIFAGGQADAALLPGVSAPDVDTGDDVSLEPLDPARFVTDCQIWISEDDPDGDAGAIVTFPDDLPTGGTIPAVSQRRSVRVGSGRYTLYYNLSGWMRRQNL
jgi:Endonuclease/Exonuclease/phosphatase family